MDIRTAIDHLILEAADGHVSAETGSYMHRLTASAHGPACATCAALEAARVFCQTGEAGDFPTGTEVTVGIARGRVSHEDRKIWVNLDNIGVVSCVPVSVKKVTP